MRGTRHACKGFLSTDFTIILNGSRVGCANSALIEGVDPICRKKMTFQSWIDRP